MTRILIPSFLFEILRERDYRVKKYKLSEIFELPISGEWGKEIGKEEHENIVKVIRTTNFTNIGKLDYNDIVLRNVEKSKVDKKKLIYGDIILEKSGGTNINPVGRVVYFDKKDMENDYITNNFTSILRVKEKNINSKYLLYYLLFNYKCGGISKYYNKTTGIQNLQVSKFLENTYFNIPSIRTQNDIVNIIEKIQKNINQRIEQLEQIEELKKSLFYEMFGDPIRNEKGWENISINEITIFMSRGKTPKYVEKSKIGVINQACIYWENIKFENIKYHENQKDVLLLKEQDILINSTGTGTLGRVNIFKKNQEENIVYTIDTHVTLLRLKKEKVNSIYLTKFFRIPIIQKYILYKCVNGSTNQIELSKEKFNKFKVLIPPLELQNKFAKKVEKIDKLKFTEIFANKSCIILRKRIK